MEQQLAVTRLDLRALAESGGSLAGQDAVTRYARVAGECIEHGRGALVNWSARGEMRNDHLGHGQIWLHLDADTSVPLTCQRCLGVVELRLLVNRWFRFVADEATAAAQDDEAEEDLLVQSTEFDLRELIEDELLLELPMIPHHEVCPTQPTFTAQDPEFGIPISGRPNPFGVLARLKSDKDGSGA